MDIISCFTFSHQFILNFQNKIFNKNMLIKINLEVRTNTFFNNYYLRLFQFHKYILFIFLRFKHFQCHYTIVLRYVKYTHTYIYN